ncbi:MAG: N-acetylneuraminate synthase [Pedobacter sp.]|nr:N-acetylneuraminate synthase [Pedobacter sp.]
MTRTIIIAEAGVNHNGDIRLAKKLVDAAVDAGVDYVKFQTFKASNIVSKQAKKAGYQKENMTNGDDTQLSMLENLEMDESMHIELIRYCEQKSIKFLSTPFDLESIELLKRLNIKLGKIPSGEITNLPYLRAMARAFPFIVLSTGMSEMEEIKDAVKVLLDNGTQSKDLIILHCNTEYPTPMQDVNLLAMNSISNELNISVGYSDHTLGIEVPIAAVALGAVMIEKHFTLDKTMEGPDHKASLDPLELKAMTHAIRNINIAMGVAVKAATPSEIKNKESVRKSIVAKYDIKKGDVFSEKNLTVKRPGNGINPMKWDEVIGKTATREFSIDDLIETND